jgi:Protein of unknown function (DUF3553)
VLFHGLMPNFGEIPRQFATKSLRMPFKEKAVVRHKLRPEWGAGRVLARTEEYIQIDFTAGGLKKLKTSIADEHLETATDEEVKALKPQKVKAAAPKKAVAKKTRMV